MIHWRPRRRAVVVVGVARELRGRVRGEGHVEEVAAPAVVAEHVERDEARAREVALVAQDAVELERVADALVDLQHHLVGHQQHVHLAFGAVGRAHQFQRLARDARALLREGSAVQHLQAALLAKAVVLPRRRAGLRVTAGACDRDDGGHREVPHLLDAATVGRQEQLFGVRGPQRRGAVHDGIAQRRTRAHFVQQVELLAQGQRACGPLVGRAVAAALARPRGLAVVEDSAARARLRQFQRARECAAQAGLGQVARGRVTQRAVVHDADHHAGFALAQRRLRDVAPHDELFRRLGRQAGRPVVGWRRHLAHDGFDRMHELRLRKEKGRFAPAFSNARRAITSRACRSGRPSRTWTPGPCRRFPSAWRRR